MLLTNPIKDMAILKQDLSLWPLSILSYPCNLLIFLWKGKILNGASDNPTQPPKKITQQGNARILKHKKKEGKKKNKRKKTPIELEPDSRAPPYERRCPSLPRPSSVNIPFSLAVVLPLFCFLFPGGLIVFVEESSPKPTEDKVRFLRSSSSQFVLAPMLWFQPILAGNSLEK